MCLSKDVVVLLEDIKTITSKRIKETYFGSGLKKTHAMINDEVIVISCIQYTTVSRLFTFTFPKVLCLSLR